MTKHIQPTDYYQVRIDIDNVPVVETFFSTDIHEMENPHIYGMTWDKVQKTLHKHYKDLSNVYLDISNDWLTKTEDEYFLPPETNQQMELW
jgi:hypothetical protein